MNCFVVTEECGDFATNEVRIVRVFQDKPGAESFIRAATNEIKRILDKHKVDGEWLHDAVLAAENTIDPGCMMGWWRSGCVKDQGYELHEVPLQSSKEQVL